MNIKRVVGDNVRFIREKRNLTQEDLSIIAHMSKTFIGDIERAKKSPTTVSLAKIAKALKIEPYILLIPDSYKQS
ncbi:MAG: helix-turn-helix transcriptional regulator [Bacteroidota bacterium]|nr:helix-turn-helix transcriptional regulator [Bacteroidota bacterium]MDP4234237.1 helix-turn-helix transcriptional regulator [Bacteroidota bacterium]MDP4243427.1 helix-turn-helix transcriptional regulator [Bacteroidota bacterium]MDP4288126.1 helix-turn-helix transcriptional regulator [Bacteroidota bacterium]